MSNNTSNVLAPVSDEARKRGYRNEPHEGINGDGTPVYTWESSAYAPDEVYQEWRIERVHIVKTEGILPDAYRMLATATPKRLKGNQPRLFCVTLSEYDTETETDVVYWSDSVVLGNAPKWVPASYHIETDAGEYEYDHVRPYGFFSRVAEVVRKGLTYGKNLDLIVHATPLTTPVLSADEAREALAGRFRSAGELLDSNITKPEWLIIGGARGSVMMVQAKHNVGKTLGLMQTSINLALGRPWEGIALSDKPLKVVYADFESLPGESKEVLVKQMNGMGLNDAERTLVRENLRIYNSAGDESDEPLLLDEPDGMLGLRTFAEDFGADVVIIDPISDAFPSVVENDNTDVKNRIVKPVRDSARRSKALWVLVHHVGKARSEDGQSEGQDNSMRARGASSLPSAMRSIIDISKAQRGGRWITVFDFTKVKGRNRDPREATLDFDTCLFNFVPLEDQKAAQKQAVWHEIKSLLECVPVDTTGATWTELSRKLFGLGPDESLAKTGDGRRSDLNRKITKAVEWGALLKDNGRYFAAHQGHPATGDAELDGASDWHGPDRLTSEPGLIAL
jgi:hypothetical protein